MDGNTQLYRQVNPNFVQENRVTSQAFCPNENDNGLLSVYDGDQITPEDSWKHYRSEFGLESAGVVAVTINECNSLNIEAILDGFPYPEHVSLDMQAFTGSQLKKEARRLKVMANRRGWLFRPPQ